MSDRKRGQSRIIVRPRLHGDGFVVEDTHTKKLLGGYEKKEHAERRAKRERKKLGKGKES